MKSAGRNYFHCHHQVPSLYYECYPLSSNEWMTVVVIGPCMYLVPFQTIWRILQFVHWESTASLGWSDMRVDRGVYTLRGWLAFVAFLDFAQALRSWLDKDVFLGSYYSNQNFSISNEDNQRCTLTNRFDYACVKVNIFWLFSVPVPSSTARLLIVYSVQNGSILLLSAFCIHHWS